MKNLKKLVDEAGELDKKIKELSQRLKEIKETLAEQGDGEYYGNNYTAIVSTSVSYEYDPKKIHKKLGTSKFLEIVKVQATKLNKYIPKAEISKYVTDTKETKRVTFKKKED